MKNYILLACCVLLMTCSKRNDDSNCRFLMNTHVYVEINMDLPQYNQLLYTGSTMHIPFNIAGGNAGIIVTKGSGYRAFDAADPNHSPSGCSTLSIEGIIGTCGCEDANKYSLLDGQPQGSNGLRCGLKEYRVDVSGNRLIISN